MPNQVQKGAVEMAGGTVPTHHRAASMTLEEKRATIEELEVEIGASTVWSRLITERTEAGDLSQWRAMWPSLPDMVRLSLSESEARDLAIALYYDILVGREPADLPQMLQSFSQSNGSNAAVDPIVRYLRFLHFLELAVPERLLPAL